MKNLYYGILVALTTLSAFDNAHGQTFVWARSGGGTSYDLGNDIAVDSDGDNYVTGWFQGNASFGTSNVVSNGVYDFYIAKYDASGNFVWINTAGGTGTDIGYSVAVDNSDNVYVTGTFENSITFGTTTLTAAGTAFFLVKYDPAGSVVYAVASSGTTECQGQAIAVDASGGVSVGGYFKGSITIGSVTLTGSTSTNATAFVVNFDSNGTPLWGKQSLGGSANVYDVDVDGSGNVYIAGYITGLVNFGSFALLSAGFNDAFFVKYSSVGTESVARREGGAGYDAANGIRVNSFNEICLAGSFENAVTFDSIQFVSSNGFTDIFLNKYNPVGGLIWWNTAGSFLADNASSLDLDASGNIYISGYFQGDFSFGTLPQLVNSGNWDTYVARFSMSGGAQWSLAGGATNDDLAYSVSVNGSYIATCGQFSSGTSLGSNNLVSNGIQDMFLARIDQVVSTLPLDMFPLSSDTVCSTVSFTVPYGITATFNTGNVFSLELSDETGDFTSPTVVGSVISTTGGAITAVVPAGLPQPLPGDSYALRIVSTNPVHISDTAEIGIADTVQPSIVISASPGTSITSGTTVTFSAVVTNGGTPLFQWKKNGVNIPGATSSTYVTSALVNNDIISCKLTSTAQCATPAIVQSNNLTMQVTVGITGPGEKTRLRIYPNPASGNIFIDNRPAGDYSFEVYSLLGRKVMNGTLGDKIDIGALSGGQYILVVINGETRQRFMITRK